MERRIEHRHLRHAVAQQVHRGPDPLEIRRVVQRGELDAVLDALDHGAVDPDGPLELFTSVHDPVSHCVDVTERRDVVDARRLRHDPPQDAIDRRAVIAHRLGVPLLLVSFRLKRE